MMPFVIPVLATLAVALGIDWAFGDPPNRYHPVAWLGRVIAFFVPRLKGRRFEMARGTVFALALVALVGSLVQLVVAEAFLFAGAFAFVLISALVLKSAIALRGMERHSLAIMNSLQEGDLVGARRNLSMIVRRDTADLGEQHILSATIECIGESTVDGIVAPIFYFSILGPAGAFAYRSINTLDSMVGYRDDYHVKIGWMSARLDTAANYIPARIAAFMMVLSAWILGADWKNALEVLHRDHTNTSSPNAGYPMASMAGALRIRLEKIGHYSLGDGIETASLQKCRTALSIMKLSTALFCVAFSAPAISILYFAGWWRVLFAWQ